MQRAVNGLFELVALMTQLLIENVTLVVHGRTHRSHRRQLRSFPRIPSQSTFTHLTVSSPLSSYPHPTPSRASSPQAQAHTPLCETRGRLLSTDSALVLLAALKADLYHLDDDGVPGNLEDCFGPHPREMPTACARLAALLPGVVRWAHAAAQGYLP